MYCNSKRYRTILSHSLTEQRAGGRTGFLCDDVDVLVVGGVERRRDVSLNNC